MTTTTMELEVVGPELAQKYLNTSAPNRSIRDGKVEQYARDMTQNEWHSSVLRLDQAGKLVDGQHRLKAVILSKTEQLFWVERGVSPKAVATIDTGMARTVGDHLSMLGEQNTNVLASALRYARLFSLFPGTPPSSQTRKPYSVTEIEHFLEKNPNIRHSVGFAVKLVKSLPIPASGLTAALHYLEMGRDRAKAVDFWDQMYSGAEQHEDTGPYTLRRQIIADRLKPLGTRMDFNTYAAICIKAWNYWEHDLPIKWLKWGRGPVEQEPFPVLGKNPRTGRGPK